MNMTIALLLFIGAITFVLAGIYRSSTSSEDTDIAVGAAFGFNLGLVWAIGFVGYAAAEMPMASLLLLIIVGACLTGLGTALGTAPALVNRSRKHRAS